MAPSTFASAAASNNMNDQNSRDTGSEWARRTNGATQTFRRPSGATTMPSTNLAQDAHATSQPSARYIPPQHRNGALSDTRYSKEQLLDLLRQQQGLDGAMDDGLQELYVGGWQPDMANGSTSAGWGRAEHSRDAQPGPDICWERGGGVEALGFSEMDDEERTLFSTSVNTPIKNDRNTANKDGQYSNGLPGRKTSLTNMSGTPGGFGLPSPSATRGGMGRRRETSESYPFPSNPLASPGADREDDANPSLLRRRTDLRDFGRSEDRASDANDKSPFGTLKRTSTGPLSAGFGAPASPWSSSGPQSAGIPPMGSFGSVGLGTQQTPSSEKRPGLGNGRAESRFKNLLSKDSSDDVGSPSVQRKPSVSSLSRVAENESWRPQSNLLEGGEDLLAGSTAIGGGSGLDGPQSARGFGTPSRPGTQDEFGFGAFGMTTDNTHGFGQGFLQGRDSYQQTPATQRMVPPFGGNEPMSPTDTNPYRSPEQHGVDHLTEEPDMESDDMHNGPLPGLGGFGGNDHLQQMGGLGGLGALPNLGRAAGNQGAASDRSQTSSVGANRGFPHLGGLGQLGNVSGSSAWPTTQPGFGTPGRQPVALSTAFGGGIFATSMGELQSPSLAGLGGAGLLGSQSGAGMGGSRMASMFPPAMQEQMRQSDDREGSGSLSQQMFGSLGLGADNNGSFPGERSMESQQAPIGAPGQQTSQTTDQLMSQQDDQSGQQPPPSSGSNQPPVPQQRMMVMPDRMRWIYRDPQGQTQGPWSGLEMHDWYKAGFFSPELLVKKYEDPDYEPLAQLIRRIGNSREPFLVPQIGIPHGPPSSNGPASWAGGPAAVTSNPTSSGGAQPPFASSFPSFGTTLTAEQQNALERRKQEEQYLMARQKEHLAQAQIAQRMGMSGTSHSTLMPGQLHHHSSAQSLHSQPSFGSMTSPTAFQPSPIQGPAAGAGHVQGFFDNSFRSPGNAGLSAVGAGVDSLGHIREEEIPSIMDRLSLNNRAAPGQFGAPGQPVGQQQPGHEQQVQQMLQDRARLMQEQSQQGNMQNQFPDELPAPNERLQQFQQLQNQVPAVALDARFQPAVSKAAAMSEQQAPRGLVDSLQPMQSKAREPLSLTEQVEKAVSAQQSPAPQQTGLPQPFPPAPSQSPLPAPAAQRTGRQSVADQLQTESRDLSETPSVETPSAAVAPWAKQEADAPRGPSLRQIQEAEAKKAAEEEALAAAARRAAFEREMSEAQQSAAIAPQPGLPASSSWGATASPATPTGSTVASAWAKAAQKPTTAVPTKTMAQIQKEEELRKKKLAAAANAAQTNAMSGVAAPAGGKSYANLAGKVGAPPAIATAGSAWTTVGAGGKTKTPITPTAPPQQQVRTTSSTGGLNTGGRKPPSRTSTLNTAAGVNALEEFKKWAVGELRPDLKKDIKPEDFVATLAELGTDIDMITEAVHSSSQTIDSRHFAEEFLRRKKLADKGLLDTTAPAAKSGSPFRAEGWSEVAKKSGAGAKAAEEVNGASGAFRVVAGKKKGGKR